MHHDEKNEAGIGDTVVSWKLVLEQEQALELVEIRKRSNHDNDRITARGTDNRCKGSPLVTCSRNQRLSASVGDKIVVTIKSALPSSQVKKGTVSKPLSCERKGDRRKDVLISASKTTLPCCSRTGRTPRNRIFGPVARELREKHS